MHEQHDPPALPRAGPPALSLAQWSLHRRLLGEHLPLATRCARFARSKLGMREPLHGDLDPLDFPVVARREFGFDAIDYIGFFYADHVQDRSYLHELRTRCDGEGVRGLTISCVAGGAIGIGHPDQKARSAIVQNHLRWFDMAAYLGCTAISVRAASAGPADEQARLVADGLTELAEWADAHGIDVLVENHDGPSRDGDWLVGLMEHVSHKRVALAPDWGHFDGPAEKRAQTLARVAPYSRGMTAKFYDFDQTGCETTMDVPASIRVVQDAGYHGPISVEYEGARVNERQGIRLATAAIAALCVL